MKKLLFIFAVCLVAALMFVSPVMAFAEEVPTQTETADTGETAPEEVGETTVESAFTKFYNSYGRDIITYGLSAIMLALVSYVKKQNDSGSLASIKLFKNLSNESENISKAVSNINDYKDEVIKLREDIKAAEVAYTQIKALQSAQAETADNAYKNIAEILYKAFSASNMAQTVKDSILKNVDNIVNKDINAEATKATAAEIKAALEVVAAQADKIANA